MKSEDLFLAIGSVEESRLARSELCMSSEREQEDITVKRKTVKTVRNLLVAVLIISMMAVAAYAVSGLLLFESPQEMLSAIFGDSTGFDHLAKGDIINQYGDVIVQQPGFHRVPVDETVIGDDVAPYVNTVGKSVASGGYTLTVDAFMYDEATKCGFFTYLLENPSGVTGYRLQSTGEIWYEGGPDIVQVNEFGYSYIIQDKTTDTCLAATYYFRDTGLFGDDLVISLPSEEKALTDEEIDKIIARLDEAIRKKLTPEEAIEQTKKLIGKAIFAAGSGIPDGADMTQEEWDAERAYTILRDKWYHEEYEPKGVSVSIPMTGTYLNHAMALNDSIVISPISFQLDATGLNDILPNIVQDDNIPVVSQLTICFTDGTEYVVQNDQLDNTIYKLVDSATEGDLDLYNRYTCMFNRIIDVDDVTAIMIDGTRIEVD